MSLAGVTQTKLIALDENILKNSVQKLLDTAAKNLSQGNPPDGMPEWLVPLLKEFLDEARTFMAVSPGVSLCERFNDLNQILSAQAQNPLYGKDSEVLFLGEYLKDLADIQYKARDNSHVPAFNRVADEGRLEEVAIVRLAKLAFTHLIMHRSDKHFGKDFIEALNKAVPELVASVLRPATNGTGGTNVINMEERRKRSGKGPGSRFA